jgi:hypothetical protein
MKSVRSAGRLGLTLAIGFLSLTCLTSAAEPADDSAELEAVLDRLQARAKEIRSLVMHTKLIKHSPAEDHFSRKKTWMLRKEDTALMRTEGRTRVTEKWMDPHQTALTTELMVIDGDTKWGQFEVYDEIRVTRETVDPQVPLAALREACQRGRARLLPAEELLGHKCVVLEVQYGEGEQLTTVTFWVAEAYGTILKMIRFDGRSKAHIETVATSLYVNQPVDEELFRYRPPEGVKVQDLDAFRERQRQRAAEEAAAQAATQPTND